MCMHICIICIYIIDLRIPYNHNRFMNNYYKYEKNNICNKGRHKKICAHRFESNIGIFVFMLIYVYINIQGIFACFKKKR